MLWNATNPVFATVWRDLDETAVGLVLISQLVRAPRDFATAFAALAATHPDGVLVLADALTLQRVVQIARIRVRERLAVASEVVKIKRLVPL